MRIYKRFYFILSHITYHNNKQNEMIRKCKQIEHHIKKKLNNYVCIKPIHTLVNNQIDIKKNVYRTLSNTLIFSSNMGLAEATRPQGSNNHYVTLPPTTTEQRVVLSKQFRRLSLFPSQNTVIRAT